MHRIQDLSKKNSWDFFLHTLYDKHPVQSGYMTVVVPKLHAGEFVWAVIM